MREDVVCPLLHQKDLGFLDVIRRQQPLAGAHAVDAAQDLRDALQRQQEARCHDDRLELEHRHADRTVHTRSEEPTSELQSQMRTSYAVYCSKKKQTINNKVTEN